MIKETFNKLKEEINNDGIDSVIRDYIKSGNGARRLVGEIMLELLYDMATERLGEADLMAFYEEYLDRLSDFIS